MNSFTYTAAVHCAQLLSTLALIQMGIEHHAVCRGDLSNRASMVHVAVLVLVTIIHVIGTALLHCMRQST